MSDQDDSRADPSYLVCESEKEDIRRAATIMANALQDLYNIIGEVDEVSLTYHSVSNYVEIYKGEPL